MRQFPQCEPDSNGIGLDRRLRMGARRTVAQANTSASFEISNWSIIQ
jgi:hypothetical protein